MSMQCEQCSLADGTCDLAWIEVWPEGADEPILEWDSENYPVDDNGYCGVDGDEFPGDNCSSYNPSNSGDYCDRCGEYLGYDDGDEDDYEESECRCND